MVTSGERVDPRAAVAMGLASDAVPGDRLLDAAIAMVRAEQKSQTYMEDRQRWSEPMSIGETEFNFLGATASAMIQGQTKGHYPAPMAALEVLLACTQVDLQEACLLEAEGFVERIRDTADRRVVKVRLTQTGKKAHNGILKTREQELENIFGCLDEKERLRFLSSLRTASSTMKRVAGDYKTKEES